MPPPARHQSRVFWDVPPLGEGEYEVALTLERGDCPSIVHPFVRHVFAWEHNRLGKSDVVVEPFTPIKVHGQTLSTILRKHTLGTLGLWDQVESLGQALLTHRSGWKSRPEARRASCKAADCPPWNERARGS